MVIEKFDSTKHRGKTMHGLTFDLDTRMLADEFGVAPSVVYASIEQKLLELGFSHVQGSVYFLTQPMGSHDFGDMAQQAFASFRYSAAVRDLQCFKIEEWSTLTEKVRRDHARIMAAGEPLWP